MINFSLSGNGILWLFLILVVSAAVLIPVMIFVVFRDANRRKYDDEKREMNLSAVRNYYEDKISEISKRLTATEDRWQEVNHLLIAAQRQSYPAVRPIDPTAIPLLVSLGLDREIIEVDPKLVFVLTPFADSEDSTFRHIVYAAKSAELIAIRGDESKQPGDILKHIVRLMLRSRLIVANVGSRNANVYYELGIAHALGKTTIVVGETIAEMPSDISTQRIVTYSNLFDLERRLLQSFKTALDM